MDRKKVRKMTTYWIEFDGFQIKTELTPEEVEAMKQDTEITIIEA